MPVLLRKILIATVTILLFGTTPVFAQVLDIRTNAAKTDKADQPEQNARERRRNRRNRPRPGQAQSNQQNSQQKPLTTEDRWLNQFAQKNTGRIFVALRNVEHKKMENGWPFCDYDLYIHNNTADIKPNRISGNVTLSIGSKKEYIPFTVRVKPGEIKTESAIAQGETCRFIEEGTAQIEMQRCYANNTSPEQCEQRIWFIKIPKQLTKPSLPENPLDDIIKKFEQSRAPATEQPTTNKNNPGNSAQQGSNANSAQSGATANPLDFLDKLDIPSPGEDPAIAKINALLGKSGKTDK